MIRKMIQRSMEKAGEQNKKERSVPNPSGAHRGAAYGPSQKQPEKPKKELPPPLMAH
jgi:hypothetical protein